MEGGVAELWVYQIQYNRWGDAEVDIYSISQQLCSEETTAFELLTLLFGRVTGTLAGEPLPACADDLFHLPLINPALLSLTRLSLSNTWIYRFPARQLFSHLCSSHF